ncbi:MAG: hypothetical protein AB8H47_20145 [Bacteroidia bacterium]
MEYKYALKQNHEDLSSGRVIYHKSGLSTFPVRLASEILMRCVSYLPKDTEISLYDPLCGEAYLLTTLGFLHPDLISHIVGSDISSEALVFAEKNLGLLTQEGLLNRQEELQSLVAQFGKDSHKQAIEACDRLSQNLAKQSLSSHLFEADLLSEAPLENAPFQADILITDVPYGSMVGWTSAVENPIDQLLANLQVILKPESIVAVVSDKSQKVSSPLFQRLKLLKAGKRRIEILKRSDANRV